MNEREEERRFRVKSHKITHSLQREGEQKRTVHTLLEQ